MRIRADCFRVHACQFAHADCFGSTYQRRTGRVWDRHLGRLRGADKPYDFQACGLNGSQDAVAATDRDYVRVGAGGGSGAKLHGVHDWSCADRRGDRRVLVDVGGNGHAPGTGT
ncbi:hypothetical protein D3C87_1637630 [compost metagenome]